jgi:pimeloyl-ACP methyl ester carboxylesterase
MLMPALAVIGSFGLAGYGGQRVAEARDRRRFPPPGRLVTVDGVALHVVVEGSGPVVLIDSGLGGGCLEWEAVAAGLRDRATVVRYDRPGAGWSPSSDCDRSPTATAERLRGLLTVLGLTEPVVVVGHSLGGLHVRLLAQLHPELVRGIVLVDPSHEEMLDAAPVPAAAKVVASVMRAFAVVAPLGVARVAGRAYAGMVAAQLRRNPDEATRERLHRATLLTSCSVHGLRTAAGDLRALPESLRQVREVTRSHPVPPVPLTVITAAAPSRTDAEAKGRLVIDALHAQQAAASPLGRQVLAEHSGHLVPLDQPELVVSCILETLTAATTGVWEAAQ